MSMLTIHHVARMFWYAAWLVSLGVTTWSAPAGAQGLAVDFPTGNLGYDQQYGVTVRTRLRSLYDQTGVQVGAFNIRPDIDQSFLYNSNVLGTSGSGSFVSTTSAAIAAQSLWPRNSLAASVGVSQNHYFSLPLNYTDFNAGISGGYTIDRDQLTGSFSHQSFHTLGTTIAKATSTTPVLNQTDSGRLAYTFRLHEVEITPELIVSTYRFGSATVQSVPINQNYLNRNVYAGGLTTRFPTAGATNVVIVVRAINSQFLANQTGQPSSSSKSVVVLAGLDLQAEGPWRYQLLAGSEFRTFTAHQYTPTASPVVQGNVIWTPTGLLTVTGTVSRTIDDPQSGGTNGYVMSQSMLRADYELQRNIMLNGHVQLQYAEFLQGNANQTSISAGSEVNVLVSRRARVALAYDYTQQSGGGVFSATGSSLSARTGGRFTQNLISLSLHLGL